MLKKNLILLLVHIALGWILPGCVPSIKWDDDDTEWNEESGEVRDDSDRRIKQLCCTILGVEDSANGNDIRKAYRILARRYHPDKNRDADSNIMYALEEARDILLGNTTGLTDKEARSATIEILERGLRGIQSPEEEDQNPQEMNAEETDEASEGGESEQGAESEGIEDID